MDKKMLSIIGGFLDGVYEVTPQMAKSRHISRMIRLCKETFLEYCYTNNVSEISLIPLGIETRFGKIIKGKLKYSKNDGLPYMGIITEDSEKGILAQYSVETMKSIYKYIKSL